MSFLRAIGSLGLKASTQAASRFAARSFMASAALKFDVMPESTGRRITEHPVVEIPDRKPISFKFDGKELEGFEGEYLTTALVANGIDITGSHPKDGSPRSYFCTIGQCGQCQVIVDEHAVKGCMTKISQGLEAESLFGLPPLPLVTEVPPPAPHRPIRDVDVLIVGGGPAGLSAAVELGKLGVEVLLVDDKDRLGGKLVLQTHKFFGTKEDSWAGTRGFEIGRILDSMVREYPSVEVQLDTNAVSVFSDDVIGLVQGVDKYDLIRPKKLMVATGAREKSLSFPGNTLPGVIGAGAFQNLVNRDLVRPCKRALIVGAGNVGVIGGYHAIQAGIEVAAVVEAAKTCSGYKVHVDKLIRLGTPVLTQHTIVEAHGKDHVERVTIAEVDENFKRIPGTEKDYEVDCVMVATGLEPCDEFVEKAREYGIPVYSAGDAKEIAEASSAMFGGKMAGMTIAKDLGATDKEIPDDWKVKEQVLKMHPGPVTGRKHPDPIKFNETFVPIFHCFQDIPCRPCQDACTRDNIKIGGDGITAMPSYVGEAEDCDGCTKCVSQCPALAITLIDYDHEDESLASVTVPYELWEENVEEGSEVTVMDDDGAPLGKFEVTDMDHDEVSNTHLITIDVPREIAPKVASIFTLPSIPLVDRFEIDTPADEAIICRCERVTAGEIRELVAKGVTDENEIKALTRTGMGACQSKTCHNMMGRLFWEEGVNYNENVTKRTVRPMYVETPLSAFNIE
eukprot:TRINITY_DN2365_c0_g1_i1.p1 TRINITY_DN2365_c0_g1~~TRINITY_DN2365_c0_g1_i1.p1  ORF type:complete len:735 (+),score=264.26 TRINITY_DN2365_c0_g1_i1:20-2224(+)